MSERQSACAAPTATSPVQGVEIRALGLFRREMVDRLLCAVTLHTKKQYGVTSAPDMRDNVTFSRYIPKKRIKSRQKVFPVVI